MEGTARKLRVLVVGAGIGGLTAAIALRHGGHEVRVFERAPEMAPVGAGISLWPNGLNALAAIGLREEVIAAGRAAAEMGFFRAEGTALGGSPVAGFEARYGAPLLMIHRGALQRALLERLGEPGPQLGCECVGVGEAGEGVAVARFADGGEEEAELIVGADGLRSAVRAATFGEAPISYSGFTAWRGIVAPGAEALEALRPGEYYGRGALFGAGPVDGEHVYWWASARILQTESPWDPAEKEGLVERFGDWAEPLGALLVATPADAILRDLLQRRPPLPRMVSGRVAMVGDSAHPMLPNLGQGACQAIEDAVELAAALGAGGEPAQALDRYSASRVSRVRPIVGRSARMARVGQLRNPLAAAARNSLMRATPSSAMARALDQIAGYEIPAYSRRG